MTDNNTTDSLEATDHAAIQSQATDSEPNPNAEAAKYRRQLREAEAARDALASQLDATRRAQIEHLTTALRVKPVALWASGATVEALLNDAGAVDPVRVEAAARVAVDALGLASGPRPDPSVGRGARSGGEWTDAFKPR